MTSFGMGGNIECRSESIYFIYFITFQKAEFISIFYHIKAYNPEHFNVRHELNMLLTLEPITLKFILFHKCRIVHVQYTLYLVLF